MLSEAQHTFESTMAPFRLILYCLYGSLFTTNLPASVPAGLLGYLEIRQEEIGAFPQWVDALERHLRDDLKDGDCGEGRLNRCHMAEWLAFLDGLRDKPLDRQLARVNDYANERPYIFDIDNYGVEDYWAIPREFLPIGGDCEDFAITKFFSLRWLGYAAEKMRIVVVQDTNLRVPHAVLSVESEETVLILDNQVDAVLPAGEILHYTPVYSINEEAWWLHLPH